MTPVIATILMVAITVILAATLYVLVFGWGGNVSEKTPVCQLSKSTTANGYRFTFTPVIPETTWSDVYVLVFAGNRSVVFDNITTAALTSHSTLVTKNIGGRSLGNLSFFMNITDLVGNGHIDQGDSFTLTTGGGAFSNLVDYEVILMHRPSASAITEMGFRGG